MGKAELDECLRAAFGVETNPFQVDEIRDGAKPVNQTAWAMIYRILGLAEVPSAQLILQLNNATEREATAFSFSDASIANGPIIMLHTMPTLQHASACPHAFIYTCRLSKPPRLFQRST